MPHDVPQVSYLLASTSRYAQNFAQKKESARTPSYMLSFRSKVLILAAGVNPYAAASDIAETQDTSDIMDKSTKAELEAVRKQTPRYLFRLWSYGKAAEPPTGEYAGLNTEMAITPLAFAKGKGHMSVYDMTREFFAEMVSRHLCVFHIETEFSS